MKLTQHPLSAAFPAMADEEYRALVNDIRQHGQRDTSTLCDGMVLDGWHRYRACEELGIPCRFDEFGGIDSVAFVRSKNQHRRHYQKSQQAAIEVALTSWADSHRPKKGEAASPFSTNKEMADRAGTTERTIQQAKRAHEAGLGGLVRDGQISAEYAAKVAKANPELAKQVAHGEKTLPQAIEELTGKRPGAKPALAAVQNEPEYNPAEDDIAELSETVKTLAEENDTLKDRLACEVMDATEEEKASALETITFLRAEVKRLEIENKALTDSRNSYQRECAELKRQCQMQRRQLEKVARAA